jgi:hypothetical protein
MGFRRRALIAGAAIAHHEATKAEQQQQAHDAPAGDQIDVKGVADFLGLGQRRSVSVSQQQYADMPRPVADLGPRRPRLWLRSDMVHSDLP